MEIPRRFPTELERMVFVLVPRQTAIQCLTVAKRVKAWLEPDLYRTVCLTTNRRAENFLQSIHHRLDFARDTVEVLCLNAAVNLDIAVDVLAACHSIKFLNMRVPCHLLGKNPILEPLKALTHIEALHVDLSSIFSTRDIFLPDIRIFHRITHLHLTDAWGWYPTTNAIGLEDLEQITHLSICFSIVPSFPALLKRLLAHNNLAVLVLWKRRIIISDDVAIRFLADFGIQDNRVLVLDAGKFRYHMLDKSFWACAEHVVRLRGGSEVLSSHGTDSVIVQFEVKHTEGDFHSDMKWVIKTDDEYESTTEPDSGPE